MRVPTYSSNMNLIKQTLNNKATFENYNFQSITGLKSAVYSGYGMKAYNIVSMEASLNVTNNFLEKNTVLNTETKMINTSLDSIYKAVNDFKALLNSFGSGGLETIAPDYTSGKIVFGNNTVSDYFGKTLTLDGIEYTFTNGNNTGNNIDIAGATNGTDIATLLETKLGSPAGYTFNGDTVEFPLYTVNGTSTALNVTGVTTGDPYTMSSDQAATVKQLQNLAFSTMKILSDSLNIQINGQFLFGGGVSNSAPASFPFASLDEFQSYYDGLNITYPTSASAQLSARNVTQAETGNLTLELDPGSTNTGTITAANAGAFLKEAIIANPNTTGNLTFDTTTNSLKATEYGAFNTLKVGDTLVLDGAAAGANAGTYIIKEISADGKTIRFEDSTPVTTNAVVIPNNDVTFSTSFPIGSVVNLDGMGNNISNQVQVTGVSADGKTLYVTVDPERFPANGSPITINASTTLFSMHSDPYYSGGDLTSEKRISENQTLIYDVNASSPAFETLFRALGQIAQGNFVDSRSPFDDLTSPLDPMQTINRTEEVINMVAQALYNPKAIGSNADLHSIMSKMANNYIVLDSVTTNQELVAVNLENSIYNIKNVDKTEAATKALMSQTNLSASYSILNSVLNMSLLNYLK